MISECNALACPVLSYTYALCIRYAQLQGYSVMVPVGWEKKGKAGADVLFEDPERRCVGGVMSLGTNS